MNLAEFHESALRTAFGSRSGKRCVTAVLLCFDIQGKIVFRRGFAQICTGCVRIFLPRLKLSSSKSNLCNGTITSKVFLSCTFAGFIFYGTFGLFSMLYSNGVLPEKCGVGSVIVLTQRKSISCIFLSKRACLCFLKQI